MSLPLDPMRNAQHYQGSAHTPVQKSQPLPTGFLAFCNALIHKPKQRIPSHGNHQPSDPGHFAPISPASPSNMRPPVSFPEAVHPPFSHASSLPQDYVGSPTKKFPLPNAYVSTAPSFPDYAQQPQPGIPVSTGYSAAARSASPTPGLPCSSAGHFAEEPFAACYAPPNPGLQYLTPGYPAAAARSASPTPGFPCSNSGYSAEGPFAVRCASPNPRLQHPTPGYPAAAARSASPTPGLPCSNSGYSAEGPFAARYASPHSGLQYPAPGYPAAAARSASPTPGFPCSNSGYSVAASRGASPTPGLPCSSASHSGPAARSPSPTPGFPCSSSGYSSAGPFAAYSASPIPGFPYSSSGYASLSPDPRHHQTPPPGLRCSNSGEAGTPIHGAVIPMPRSYPSGARPVSAQFPPQRLSNVSSGCETPPFRSCYSAATPTSLHTSSLAPHNPFSPFSPASDHRPPPHLRSFTQNFGAPTDWTSPPSPRHNLPHKASSAPTDAPQEYASCVPPPGSDSQQQTIHPLTTGEISTDKVSTLERIGDYLLNLSPPDSFSPLDDDGKTVFGSPKTDADGAETFHHDLAQGPESVSFTTSQDPPTRVSLKENTTCENPKT